MALKYYDLEEIAGFIVSEHDEKQTGEDMFEFVLGLYEQPDNAEIQLLNDPYDELDDDVYCVCTGEDFGYFDSSESYRIESDLYDFLCEKTREALEDLGRDDEMDNVH